MAVGGAVVAAAIYGVSTGVQVKTQQAAAQKSEDLATIASEAERRSTEEQVRRTEEENQRREASARARAAASGVGGVSTEIYIEALEQSGREEIDWLKEVGASAYQSSIASGQVAVAQSQAAMWSTIGSGITAVAGAA